MTITKNWKTTGTGSAAVLIAIADIINSIVAGTSINVADIAAIVSGIGLIFAKDHNVTGGTVQQ